MIQGVETSQFFGCCGIYVVYNHIAKFAYNAPLGSLNRDIIKKDLQERIRQYTPKIGILLMALNHYQVETGLGDVFKECGFKELMTNVLHAGTKSRLTLYGLNLHEDVKPETKQKFKAA